MLNKQTKNNATCLSAVNTQTLLLLRQPSEKHTLKGVHMHAYLSRLWNDLLAWLCDRSNRRFDHQITQRTFEVSGRDSQGDRSPTLPHRLCWVWVHRAFGSHSKVWSWSLDSSATRIGRAFDCRRGRVKKKKRVKRSMLLNWLGHVRQLPSFPLCETFPQIP